MTRHNSDQVALVASMLLQGRVDAEPHHIRQAVATARMILDEARAGEEAEEAAPLSADGEKTAA